MNFRLNEVTLTNVGIVKGPVRIALEPGLNVVHAPNESGKSTVRQALYDVFTLRSKTSGEDLARFVPHDGGVPEIAVVFTLDGIEYRLAKRYAKTSGTTTLEWRDGSGPRVLKSDDAEARLRELMHTAEAKRGRGDTGLWPLLWVAQGHSGRDPISEIEKAGQDQLQSTLGRLTGEVLSGPGALRLMARIEGEYRRFFTDTGREREGGPIAEARKALAAAVTRVEEHQHREREHAANVDAYVKADADHRKLLGETPKLGQIVAAAKVRLDRVNDLVRERAELATAHALAQGRLQGAEQALANRTSARTELDRLKGEVVASTTLLDGARRDRDAKVTELDPLKTAVVEATARQQGAERLRRRAAAQQEALAARREADELAHRLRDARARSQALVEAQTRLATLKVTDATVAALDRKRTALDKAKNLADGAASGLRLEAVRAVGIAIDGATRTLAPGEVLETLLLNRTRLAVGDVAELVITPGGEELSTLRTALDKAQRAWDDALVEAGVPDLETAKQLASERREQESKEREAKAALTLLAAEGIPALEAKQSAAQARAEDAEKQVIELTRLGDPSMAEDEKSARALLRQAETAASEAQRTLDEARKALASADTALATLAEKLRSAEAAANRAVADVTSAERRLTEAITANGEDGTLAEAVQAARVEAASRGTALKAKTDELSAEDPEAAKARVASAEKALDDNRRYLADARSKVDQLAGVLSSRDLHGLHEALGEAIRVRDEAQATVDAEAAKASAAKLLFETFRAARQEAQQRFTGPLRIELEPLLRTAFPGATADVDESFRLTHLRRPGSTDAFDSLSGGAKEQLAVLARLAFGKVLAEGGTVPVLLDDALPFTDEDRLQRMVEAVSAVSRRLQVVLFTCHWERYRAVGMSPTNLVDLAGLRRTAEARTRVA